MWRLPKRRLQTTWQTRETPTRSAVLLSSRYPKDSHHTYPSLCGLYEIIGSRLNVCLRGTRSETPHPSAIELVEIERGMRRQPLQQGDLILADRCPQFLGKPVARYQPLFADPEVDVTVAVAPVHCVRGHFTRSRANDWDIYAKQRCPRIEVIGASGRERFIVSKVARIVTALRRQRSDMPGAVGYDISNDRAAEDHL